MEQNSFRTLRGQRLRSSNNSREETLWHSEQCREGVRARTTVGATLVQFSSVWAEGGRTVPTDAKRKCRGRSAAMAARAERIKVRRNVIRNGPPGM